jgi:hypothetical protein
MTFPATPTQLAVNQSAPQRPVYDIPPVIVRSRRFGRIPRPYLHLTRARPTQPAGGSREAIACYRGAVLASECRVRFDDKESR